MPAVSKERRDFLCGSCELGDVHQWQLISRISRLEQHRCSRLIEHDEPVGVLLTCFCRLCLRFRGELHRFSLKSLLLRARLLSYFLLGAAILCCARATFPEQIAEKTRWLGAETYPEILPLRGFNQMLRLELLHKFIYVAEGLFSRNAKFQCKMFGDLLG